ncbi:hypothetical protein BDR04DRAFT_1097176 [Suillus decipiens]|nr:hypothetical protein BDR04DRAFT_1097176 [Suillus decipiens]
MKLVQIIYLAILAAAPAFASVTEVTTADSPESSVSEQCLMAKPGCVLERPSNCPPGSWPAQPFATNINPCWFCCSNT